MASLHFRPARRTTSQARRALVPGALLFTCGVLSPKIAAAAHDDPASEDDDVELSEDTPESSPGDADGSAEREGVTVSTETRREDTGHQGQFSVRLGVVAGYRMMFRYGSSPFCGPPSSSEGESCTFGAPLATDVAIGFAPLDAIEVFAWGRFGLARETKTDTDALRAFGAGVRIYTSSDAPLKVFIQPAVAWSFEGGGSHPDWRSRGATVADYRTDMLFHFSVGPQYDFNRYFGLYAGGGMTVGALRSMSATLEGTLGVQGRYP